MRKLAIIFALLFISSTYVHAQNISVFIVGDTSVARKWGYTFNFTVDPKLDNILEITRGNFTVKIPHVAELNCNNIENVVMVFSTTENLFAIQAQYLIKKDEILQVIRDQKENVVGERKIFPVSL